MAGQLSDYVLGVRPTSSGYRTWTFEPRLGNLAFAEGRVPTPKGVIEARWERVGDRLKCRVKALGVGHAVPVGIGRGGLTAFASRDGAGLFVAWRRRNVPRAAERGW